MIKQLGVAYKTAAATLTYAELGDVVVNSATAVTITLPVPNKGLWYRISNVGAGLVTIYYGATITTLKQAEQVLLLANGTTAWWMSKGREAMTKAEIEAVLTGKITSHTHDFTGLSDVPANYTSAGGKFVKVNAAATGLEFVVGEAIASAFTDLTDAPNSYVGSAEKIVAVNITEDALVFIDAPTGGGLVIDPNHIFADNIARDNYFTTNPTERITGIYISVGTGFQQWDGATWLDKTAVVTGPIGADGADGLPGADGAGVPVGGTAGQILSKIDATDNNTEWVTPSGGIVTSVVFGGNTSVSTRTESACGDKILAMIDTIAIAIMAYTVWTIDIVFTVKLWNASASTVLASGTIVGDGTTSWKTVNLSSEYPITQFAEYHISIERPSLSIAKYYLVGSYKTAFLNTTATYSGLPTSQSSSGDSYAIGIKIRL